MDKKDREAAAEAHGVNLANTIIIPEHNRVKNIFGELPKQKERLFGTESNFSVAKRLGVSTRQASKIRNHRRPMPDKKS